MRSMSPAPPPLRRPRPLRRGLFGQILLWSILPASLVLALLAGLRCWDHYQNRLAVARATLRESAQAVANWLDAKNSEAISAARILTAVQRAGIFGQRKTTLATMRKTMEELGRVSSITIAYEPMPVAREPAPAATDGQAAPAAEPEMVRFVAGWTRGPTPEADLVQRQDTGMEESACYRELKAKWESRQDDLPIVGDPVVEGGQAIIEYACPIVANGRFYGALKLDRAIADLQPEFEAIAKGGNVDMYVVSPKGRVVVACAGSGRAFASDPAGWTARSVDELQSGGTLRRIMAAGGGTDALPDPATGGRTLFASAATGTSGWMVIVGVDERTVLAPIQRETLRTAAIAATGIAALAAMAYVPARRMARRIRTAVDAAQQVASGDLTRPAGAVASDDEIGDLLRAIDRMTLDLSALVGKVHHATSSLRGTAGELASGADGQRLATSAFHASSEGISAAVQQITSTARQLSSEMERVNAMALDTSARAQTGRAKLESMESAMVSLNDATGLVAERLAAINGRASNIGGVVTTISKVAEHTHLLSVNAAIEAQKAGEYGRGFLVVAREIRRLADQTAQATLDIERIVREMQAAVAGGVSDMDRFGEQVRGNVAEARELSRSMSEIIVSVEESTRSFGAVREGIGRQAEGAEQITGSVAVLAGNAGASADAAGEFLGAAEALNRSIDALDTAAAALRVRA